MNNEKSLERVEDDALEVKAREGETRTNDEVAEEDEDAKLPGLSPRQSFKETSGGSLSDLEGKEEKPLRSDTNDGSKPAAANGATPQSLASSTRTNSRAAAAAARPRNNRAQRLARKREQLNEYRTNPSPPPRSRTPAHATRQSATARAALPGDDLVPLSAPLPGDDLVPSEAITSRSRPALPTGTPNEKRRAVAPPPVPRAKGGTVAAVPNPQPTTTGTDSENPITPGAFPEHTRATGDIPSWARDGITATAAPSAEPECNPAHVGRPSDATTTLSAEDRDVENSGLAAAEPVAAETVVYAEDIKEDEMVKVRRKFGVFAAAALVTIVALLAGLIASVVLLQRESDNVCDLPLEEQTISLYCRCNGSTKGYMDYKSRDDPDLSLRLGHITDKLKGNEWLKGDTDTSSYSCDHEVMVVQAMALHSKGVQKEDFKLMHISLGERYFHQLFALTSLYFMLNGDEWERNEGWLTDPLVCSWEGLSCDFPTRVSAVRLAENNLEGELTGYLSLLARSMKKLDLSGNPIHGQIPHEYGQLSRLAEMDLSNLKLNGTIPSELGNLTGLHKLDLSNNALSGSLPTQFENLRLFLLRVDNNTLTGTLPSIGKNDTEKRLQFLSLKLNQLSGTIPEDLFELKHLEYVDLSNNSFTGALPDFISAAEELAVVNFIGSGLDGVLPDPYCVNSSDLYVLADCRDIFECDCCPKNATNERYEYVLKCAHEWKRATMAFVNGIGPGRS